MNGVINNNNSTVSQTMKTTDLINGKVRYDKNGKYLWINSPDGSQILADIRGWGQIKNMFPMTKEGQREAEEYHDKIGEFIADAINEKINNGEPL